MQRNESLIYMLTASQQVLKSILDDITEEESMVIIADNTNHIRWQVGHLISSAYNALSLFGQDSEERKEFDKSFGYGSVISKETSDYPSFEELRAKLYDLQAMMIQVVGNLSDEVLEQEIGDADQKRPLWQPMSFLRMHDLYHAGQIVMIRRSLGRDKPFG